MRVPRPKVLPSYRAGSRAVLVMLVPPLAAGLLLGLLATAGMSAGHNDIPAPVASPSPPSATTESTTVPSSTSSDPTETSTVDTTDAGSDPVGGARVGDCFGYHGDVLTPADSCGTGTYQVLARLDGTTDTSRCDHLPGDDLNVPDSGHDLVLCLTFHFGDDAAAHAATGSCVGQPAEDDGWFPYPCQPGTFKVLGRFYGTTEGSGCRQPRADQWVHFSDGDGRVDLVLCLTYQYSSGGDAGYAKPGNCMARVTSGNLYFAESCARANAVITGRTATFDDKSFCGNDGWITEEVRRYPDLTFTACWRWR